MIPHILSSQNEPETASVRRLSILGSTGSIGTQTLDIVRLFPDALKVTALSAGRNAELLAKQALEFHPEIVVIQDESKVTFLENALAGTGILVTTGESHMIETCRRDDVDVVMAAVVGFAGLTSVLAAIEAEKVIGLANKETLVVAGQLMKEALIKFPKAKMIPVDSEHSAIFQCLLGEPDKGVESIILTASGGPFRTWPKEKFASITRAQALNHPNWSMGAKITIDSASMMNKGLEVIEARWLFDLPAEKIKVLVHPQSIIHSMVEFVDGSTKAQLGVPDMKVPIQYAVTWPNRWPAPHERLDWAQISSLDFEQPDFERFPCLALAFEVLSAGGTAPAVLNAANEAAVALFLEDKIHFQDIPTSIRASVDKLAIGGLTTLDQLVDADKQARQFVQELNRVTLH